MSVKLRLKYAKTGKAKYISHLDLSETMHRALLRAEIPLKYSEGFNPHPYISVALPLKVGDESVCELLDFAVIKGYAPSEDFAKKLCRALPEGIEIFGIYPAARKFSQIAWIEIQGNMYYEHTVPRIEDEIIERFSSEEILILKKTKSGISELNIAPFLKDIIFSHEKNGKKMSVSAKVSAQNPSISPDNIISALDGRYRHLMPRHYSFFRTELMDADFLPFK